MDEKYLDKFKRSQIRSLLQDDRFRAIEDLQKIVITEISKYEVKANNEFETLWRLSKKEGGIEVLNDFFSRLIFEASKSDE